MNWERDKKLLVVLAAALMAGLGSVLGLLGIFDTEQQVVAPLSPATGNEAADPDGEFGSFRVQDGDTLELYSGWSGCSVKELRRINGLSKDENLTPGRTFRLFSRPDVWIPFHASRDEHWKAKTAEAAAAKTKPETTEPGNEGQMLKGTMMGCLARDPLSTPWAKPDDMSDDKATLAKPAAEYDVLALCISALKTYAAMDENARTSLFKDGEDVPTTKAIEFRIKQLDVLRLKKLWEIAQLDGIPVTMDEEEGFPFKSDMTDEDPRGESAIHGKGRLGIIMMLLEHAMKRLMPLPPLGLTRESLDALGAKAMREFYVRAKVEHNDPEGIGNTPAQLCDFVNKTCGDCFYPPDPPWVTFTADELKAIGCELKPPTAEEEGDEEPAPSEPETKPEEEPAAADEPQPPAEPTTASNPNAGTTPPVQIRRVRKVRSITPSP